MTTRLNHEPILIESSLLLHKQCRHGFFNRHGGISRGLHASLNVGHRVGDDPVAVAANRQVVKNMLGAKVLLSAHQTHGVNVVSLREDPADDLEVDDADALITDRQGVAVMVQTADCQPILLHDPGRKVVAAVHSGWRGSVQNILQETVAAMSHEFGCHPVGIRAAIGPSLGPCCAEFINHKQELPDAFNAYRDAGSNFDFWKISVMQLKQAGLLEANIDVIGICSKCSPDHYSYRGSSAQGEQATGRLASVIMLR